MNCRLNPAHNSPRRLLFNAYTLSWISTIACAFAISSYAGAGNSDPASDPAKASATSSAGASATTSATASATTSATTSVAASPNGSAPPNSAELVNINRASPAVLALELKGIGPSKAEAIVLYREKHGAFVAVDELVNVKGIGPKTLEKLRTHIVAGDFKKPDKGQSLAEQEISARKAVQAVVKRSLEIRKTAASHQ